ncbi:S-layer homology domain-containing protein [Lysinibacillus sphaericus]|uniref:S-layer homology domain-containing protein n=1 Tax=Lysinibacillus sphaericus TaxID=1421 RepID=UPI003F78B43D
MKKKTMVMILSATLATTPFFVTNVDVQAVQTAQVNYENPFKDIKPAYDYFKIVHEMRNQGIINGYPDNTFRPNDVLSRKHAATLVYRAVDGKLPKKFDEIPFKDLPKDHYYYTDIQTLAQAGLLDAEAGNILPDKQLSRGEMAKILVTAFNLEIPAEYDSSDYDLVDMVNNKYQPYVRALYANGVTTGYGDAKFEPNQSLSRAHYAVFMYRAMEAIDRKNSGEEFVPTPVKDKLDGNAGNSDKDQNNNSTDQNNNNNPNDKGPTDNNNSNGDITKENVHGKLEQLRKDHPELFERPDLAVNEDAFKKNLVSAEVLLKNYEVISKNGLQIYAGTKTNLSLPMISFTKKGYENPKKAGSPTIGTFHALSNGTTEVAFDFREASAKNALVDLLAAVHPNIVNEVKSQINDKISEAVSKENSNTAFKGNLTTTVIDGYELYYGVNSAFERMVIRITPSK